MSRACRVWEMACPALRRRDACFVSTVLVWVTAAASVLEGAWTVDARYRADSRVKGLSISLHCTLFFSEA